ncbi:TPA: LysR family transcriptional regulator [Klebsiella quasipneumoniae subsp. quasipneumoniae]|nr:LysR family transcriptional regulator [Klebsiella quasipneumoniae subsp. quasipneumoniae]
MHLEDIRIFVTIVNMGSFTAAAEHLSLSKQFVSRRMAALEKKISARLLVRNTRKLSVTDIGQAFFHHALRILEEVHEAEEVISTRQQKLAGAFRISLPMTYGIRRLAPMIIEFQATHPELTIHINMNDRYVDVVGEGYDMVLRIGNLLDSTLIARCLGTLPMVICASPDYLRLHGTPLVPSELAQHNCLLYGREGQFGWKLTEENSVNTYAVRGNLSSNNGDVIRKAAEAGAGFALLPLFIVEDSLQRGALVQILSDYSPPPLTISALYPKHRQCSAVTQILLPFLAERISSIVDPLKKE